MLSDAYRSAGAITLARKSYGVSNLYFRSFERRFAPKPNNKLYPNVIRLSEGFARARKRGVTIIGACVRRRKNVVFTAWPESVKTASIYLEAFCK
jgi:hypothetical protein